MIGRRSHGQKPQHAYYTGDKGQLTPLGTSLKLFKVTIVPECNSTSAQHSVCREKVVRVLHCIHCCASRQARPATLLIPVSLTALLSGLIVLHLT